MLEPPQILALPAQRLAVVRLTIPRAEMIKHFDPAVRQVSDLLKAQAAPPVGPVTVHYFSIAKDIFDFELGFPIAGPIAPEGGVYLAEQPAQRVIRTVYTGPYADMPSAWGVFQNHIVAKGYRFAADFREAYLNDPNFIADPTEYRTELIRILLDEATGASLNRNEAVKSIAVTEAAVPPIPFGLKDTPVTLKVQARKLPLWRAEDGTANPLPLSPVASTEPDETITLVPYAAAKLRITAFPELQRNT